MPPKDDLQSHGFTPFGARKTAEQQIQFAMDPSFGLTRHRYQWFTNGNQFDSSFFSNESGAISIQTGTGATDYARIKSAFYGVYVSQAEAQPGLKVYFDESNLEFDDEGYVSTTHGRIIAGPFLYDGSQINDGFGIEINETGAYAFWIKDSSHKGNSPVPQWKWDSDQMNGSGPSGIQFSPGDGYILNFPYTWYNGGRLGIGIIDSIDNEFKPMHEFSPTADDPGPPSLATPNLPVQTILDNDGATSSLNASIGGMQYTLYGSSGTPEQRESFLITEDKSFTDTVSPPVTPTTNPGTPIYAVRREPETKAMGLSLNDLEVQPDVDCYIYFWDTWTGGADLTGQAFQDPHTNFPGEVRSQVDRSATAFDATNSILRDAVAIGGGNKNKVNPTESSIEKRISSNATRVVTAIGKTNSGSIDYVAKNKEAF